MDDIRVGMALRSLRLRAGLRQIDVARAAGVSQSLVSAVECGRLATLPVGTLRRIFAAVGAGFDGQVIWRGPGIDRLLDARHASLVEASVLQLRSRGWDPQVEVTYSIYGERGSIDVLGGRFDCRAVVVEEIKSDLVRIDDTVRKLDEKERLVGRQIAKDRFSWQPDLVGRILILPDTDRARRQVKANAAVLDAAFPHRGSVVRQWLRAPEGPVSGILFVADASLGGATARGVGVERVRIAAGRSGTADATSADFRDGPGCPDGPRST
jgi:transcriptional regulator with XRE-family HTH domain